MQKLIIVFALVTCCLAAPLEKPDEPSHKPGDLIRPSPINPDIPSDPKPEEKITLITDPQVTPVTTANPEKLPGPFVVPISGPLLRAKREDKESSEESDEKSSEEEKDKKSSRPLAASPSSLPKKLSTTPVPSTTLHSGGTTSGVDASSTSTHPRIPYAPHIHQHNEHLFKPSTTTTKTTEAHLSGSSSSSSSISTSTTSATPLQDHANEKRDIPVPLTRKYHHSDDDETKSKEEPSPSSSPSPSLAKVPKEKINQEEKKDEGNKAEPVAVDQLQHPAAFARPIPVAELFAKKPSTD